jgi:pyruvate/2-oxoglutarate dehydrogenase complex dihydrolipoamide acyltransferase (E2) component
MPEFASPAAEEAAEGLSDEDLEQIEGTGTDGKITKGDVEAFLDDEDGDGDPDDSGPAGERIDSLKGVKRDQLVVLEPLTHGGRIYEEGEDVPEFLDDEALDTLVRQGAVGKRG